MTVHHARVLALAAVLVGISAVGPSTRLHAQQALADLPLDELHALAEQGDAVAQFNLGVMYENGRGVPQDDAYAGGWYRLAADQGYADAQFNLGIMYAFGVGMPQDYAEAVRWYRLAADQGHAPAQGNLGDMYADGQGVPKDYVDAHLWLNLAAAQSSGEDRDRRVKARDDLAERMTAEQLAEARRRAREWTPTPEP